MLVCATSERLPRKLRLFCYAVTSSHSAVQNNIVNAERRGKRQVLIRPSSKVIVKFLTVMQRHGERRLLIEHFFPNIRSEITTIGEGCISTSPSF